MTVPRRQTEQEQLLQAKWKDYVNDPVKFAYEVVQIERLDPWQQETLMALANNSLVAVAAGVGVGKEVVAALSILWFLCTRPYAKVAATSASAQQVQVALWMELQKWISHSQILPHLLEWTPSTIQVKGYGERWRAFQSVAAKRISAVTGEAQAEGGAGIHEEHLLIVISEASGVGDEQFDAKISTLVGGKDNRALVIGNPVRRSGRFYQIFIKPEMKKHWWTRNVDHRESSFVSKEATQRLIDTHGEDSALVQARVHGQFPLLSEGKTIFGYQEIEDAFYRDYEDNVELPLQVGVDVARYGHCETVIITRRGNVVLNIRSFQRIDLMRAAAYTVQEATRWWLAPSGHPREHELDPEDFQLCQENVLIVVDEVGIGGGVIDALRSQGWHAVGINNGSKARNPRHYASRGDELWFVDGKLAIAHCSIPQHDEELQHQLCNREVRYDRTGTKRRVETKDELLRRGLSSPDRADAFLLAFATVTSQKNYDYSYAIRIT